MISESILNNIGILSPHILNNMGFSTHWETESVMAELIVVSQKSPVRSNYLYIHVIITQKSSY